MTSAAADYPQLCLYRIWGELTARGFAVDEPVTHGTCQCFFDGLRGAQVEMDLMDTGALVWVYFPLPQADISPEQAARLVLALLGTGPVPGSLPPAPDTGLALKDAASQMLAACGLAARPVDIRYDVDEVYTEVMATNPARPARGHARISDEGTVRWECPFAAPASPASGLAPSEVAQAHRRRPSRISGRRARRCRGQRTWPGRWHGDPDLTKAASWPA